MRSYTTSQTEPITTHASVDIYVYNETKSEFVFYNLFNDFKMCLHFYYHKDMYICICLILYWESRAKTIFL